MSATPAPTPSRTAPRGCAFHDDQGVANGLVNLPLALTESDDYYFYQLGDSSGRTGARYGPRPYKTSAKQYGLDSYTHIDLPVRERRVRQQPDRAEEALRAGPQGVPQREHLDGRRQHRDGVRPERRAHPVADGRRLRHLRQRRHPLHARRWPARWSPPTAEWSSASRPRSWAGELAAVGGAARSSRASRAWWATRSVRPTRPSKALRRRSRSTPSGSPARPARPR